MYLFPYYKIPNFLNSSLISERKVFSSTLKILISLKYLIADLNNSSPFKVIKLRAILFC